MWRLNEVKLYITVLYCLLLIWTKKEAEMKKKVLTAVLVFAMVLTVIAPMTVFANWEKQSNGSWKYYSESEGDYLKETILKVDGKAYYFDSDGWMQTGWIRDYDSFWAGVPYDWYYANSKGELQTGWQYIDGKWYYFDEKDYYMYYGGNHLINGKNYFFYPAGAMGTGWIKKTYIVREEYVYTIWYYANSSGELQKGWQKIGGVWYYFNPESFKMTDYGCYTINGKTYYFDENGKMGTGWCKYDYGYGSDWYYANSSGALQKGWQKIGGVWYYFDEDYRMLSNAVCCINGVNYAFASSGAWISGTGWYKLTDYGETRWIYTQNGKVLTGWQKIGGTWYYFDSEGYMIARNTVIDRKLELFNASGAWQSTHKTLGWFKADSETWLENYQQCEILFLSG